MKLLENLFLWNGESINYKCIDLVKKNYLSQILLVKIKYVINMNINKFQFFFNLCEKCHFSWNKELINKPLISWKHLKKKWQHYHPSIEGHGKGNYYVNSSGT